MNNKQEISADIIAEMRNLGKLDEKSSDKIPRTLMGLGLRTYADRLEAAVSLHERYMLLRLIIAATRRLCARRWRRLGK